MEYISLKQSEYFEVHSGASIPNNDEEFWGDRIDYVVPTDFSQRNGVSAINQTRKMLSNVGLQKAKNRTSPINAILLQRKGALAPKIVCLPRDNPTYANYLL